MYKAHLFLCINETENKPCCAKKGMVDLHKELKMHFKQHDQAVDIRINKSGCLDFCGKGGAAVIYPSGRWFFNLEAQDFSKLSQAVEDELRILKSVQN